jgi:hypothetical protein
LASPYGGAEQQENGKRENGKRRGKEGIKASIGYLKARQQQAYSKPTVSL